MADNPGWKVGDRVAIKPSDNGYICINASGAEKYFGITDGVDGWSIVEVVADEPMIAAGRSAPHGTEVV
jgi:hypothetical protein